MEQIKGQYNIDIRTMQKYIVIREVQKCTINNLTIQKWILNSGAMTFDILWSKLFLYRVIGFNYKKAKRLIGIVLLNIKFTICISIHKQIRAYKSYLVIINYNQL